jgi:hypothetical protein
MNEIPCDPVATNVESGENFTSYTIPAWSEYLYVSFFVSVSHINTYLSSPPDTINLTSIEN